MQTSPRRPLAPFRRLRLAWLLLLASSASCLGVTPAGPVFDTQPPGARVLIDGRDTGYATPCQIALDEDENYNVRFELDGFEPAEVRLRENSRSWIIPLSMAEAYKLDWYFIPSRFFLPIKDFSLPRRTDDSHAPWRVFVQLRPAYGG